MDKPIIPTSLASGQHFKSGGHRPRGPCAQGSIVCHQQSSVSSIIYSNNHLLQKLSTSTIALLDSSPMVIANNHYRNVQRDNLGDRGPKSLESESS